MKDPSRPCAFFFFRPGLELADERVLGLELADELGRDGVPRQASALLPLAFVVRLLLRGRHPRPPAAATLPGRRCFRD